MLSDFIHSRPLLRAFLACVLMTGLIGTAAATHIDITHAMSHAAEDAANGDIDTDDDRAASAEDNCVDDTLVVPAAWVVPGALQPHSRPMNVHLASDGWRANSELRPPIR